MSLVWLSAAGHEEEESELITAGSNMAVSTSEPLCQPCAYHEAFKGKSQHCPPVLLFRLFVFFLSPLFLFEERAQFNTPTDPFPLVLRLHPSVDLEDGQFVFY